jgi:imidazolonepropionase-like amidohydrolase
MHRILYPLVAFCCLLAGSSLLAQTTSFPTPAPSDPRSGAYAFTNATIYTDYKTRVEGATLLIRQGKVVVCGAGVAVPKDAALIDCSGKTIYPAFIDLYATDFGMGAAPAAAPAGGGGGGQRNTAPPAPRKGAFGWNEAIKSEFNAAEKYAYDEKSAEEWRKLGFATLLTHQADGISRGSGALVSLTPGREQDNILAERASHHLSFRKGSSTMNYPNSLMGCIALIRQTYLDASWYKTEGYKTEKNLSLEAWNSLSALPQIFEASDKLDILRIGRIGQEFNQKFIVKTNGDEYQRLDDIKAAGMGLIVPLAFPEGFDVRDPFEAQNFPLRDLKHWELAPANPARLEAAGIPFALTTNGLRDKSKFWENLRKAIEYGLTEENALKALTWQPAQFLGQYGALGSLEPGKTASFFIASGNIFKQDGKIHQVWCKGTQNVLRDPADAFPDNINGDYTLRVGPTEYPLFIKGKTESPDVYLLMSADTTKRTKATLSLDNGIATLSFAADSTGKKNYRLAGALIGTTFSGQGQDADGAWINWRATQTKAQADKGPGKQAPVRTPETGDMLYPFTAFGWKEKPKQGSFIIQNATVWTSEKEAVLSNTDVLVSNGKIQKIGKKLSVPDNATVIDGTGKYLTAGIIDEHSHIAVSRSVNEGSQESTAEVRIGDVLDSEDIDIYRQLAGGVTSSHLLHGSANPIGGQTQLIKLRWGAAPEDLKFQNWPGFIKFALGENVKQSNFSGGSARYPQTRMGVEQTYMDYFTRAQEYGQLKKSGKPYRKDLELEALLEIIESKRFITCHSYVQSEITMMMRVAERFNFKLNTFTHILEGYKVADKMAKHGAYASTFSDWWAYKYEVYEAIPQNARLMTDRGVTVAINSDDAEMARRLNQEAAKSVGYANMTEAEAWRMVTINPAKMLHVEDRVGSIKTGKDADLVLWNNNPLSVYARPEKTWVDGIQYYDLKEDRALSEYVARERNRLIQKLMSSKKGGEGGERPSAGKKYYHCDSNEDEGK